MRELSLMRLVVRLLIDLLIGVLICCKIIKSSKSVRRLHVAADEANHFVLIGILDLAIDADILAKVMFLPSLLRSV